MATAASGCVRACAFANKIRDNSALKPPAQRPAVLFSVERADSPVRCRHVLRIYDVKQPALSGVIPETARQRGCPESRSELCACLWIPGSRLPRAPE
jgi:hypothetical protein